jgi:hypothetical protein
MTRYKLSIANSTVSNAQTRQKNAFITTWPRSATVIIRPSTVSFTSCIRFFKWDVSTNAPLDLRLERCYASERFATYGSPLRLNIRHVSITTRKARNIRRAQRKNRKSDSTGTRSVNVLATH